MKRDILWSNYPYDFENEELWEMRQDFMDYNDGEEPMDDWELVDWAYGWFDLDYLQKETSRVNGYIVTLADLGLWDGRKHGYKMSSTYGDRIGSVLESDCEYCTWFFDENDELCFKGVHHDGTNYYRYFFVPDEVSSELTTYEIDELLYNNDEMTKAILKPITKDMLFE